MAGGLWVVVTVLLLAGGIILRQVPLILISLLFFLSGAVARLWGENCLKRVEYRRRLSSDHVFFGEEVELETEVTNLKPLPLPWLQIEDNIPADVTLMRGTTSLSFSTKQVLLSSSMSLGWYHRVKKRYRMQCRQRGYFTFGPAHLRSGDLFGFITRESEIKAENQLLVYPRVLPVEKATIPSSQPLGNVRTKSHLFQDPVLTLGVREYRFGDSLKHIHWKASARRGELQTRVFEPTTTVDMGIFLDVRTVPPPLWGSEPELLELSIITAASVAREAISEGYRVGLCANHNRRESSQLIRIAPGAQPGQLKNILEALACIQPLEVLPFARLIANENRNLPWGSTVTAITAAPTEALMVTLLHLQKAGRKVVLIVVGTSAEMVFYRGLTTYFVSNDVPWGKIERLRLETGVS